MKSNWCTVKLQEIVLFKTGKLDSNAADEQGDYPFFTCSPVTLAINEYAFDTEAVLLAGNNANGVFSVKYYNGKFNAYQRTYVITPIDKSIVSVRWLYFRIKHVTAELQQMSVGTATKFLTKKILDAYEVQLPPIVEQEKQAQILWNLQNKLDLNTQNNQTLEQMAQAIFKSWFVDFEPVKAKMRGEQPEGMDEATASLFPEKLVSDTGLPEGWKLSEIGDEVAVVGGGTPSKKNDNFWVGGHIHWTSPKDLSGVQDKVLLDTASKLTEAGLKKVSSGLLPVDTVLLSSRAPVGYLALAKVPLAVNQGYIAMKCEKALPPEFVLQWCVHRMDEIKQRASGSTFAEISKKNFKPISVVVPSEDVLNAYQKLVKPLYDAITSNVRQSEQLSTLRDTLLPKLLSGELHLTDPVEVTNV
ncbi:MULTISPECIES: restriction endonuclease subunit S [Vibrio]|uniref:restriction endonuclease subunit S n=1 Tax=Vibrio TaxID=662 RepID=UPI000B5D07F8|nr:MULTISPECIES: restriction endonuclease subunit S [Vibrio]HBV76924.1 restriction endonuclease subunit S [Vibrio sp.]